ncbi:uncharacterized protein EAE98_009771 [Botrytis deweyae]|uniref:Uncharacterized protein n=1 Tax=Botrytis deweyae TaxID=2478750 RepID=A0ABQ7IB66_9HELO|nr:uncharacterized protein EAE98_009771 [Botrytis deweyae]KAF7918528.1 hypothetical protein EAE98_009771 [Botrytis deweyae]
MSGHFSITDPQNHPRRFFDQIYLRELICPSGRGSNFEAICKIYLWGLGVFNFVCPPGPYILKHGNWVL